MKYVNNISHVGAGHGRSIRDHLRAVGVTSEEAIRGHLSFILETEKTTGHTLDLSRYRPSSNPNVAPFIPVMS